MQVNWTRCSERMPPDDENIELIARSSVNNSLQIISSEKIHLLKKFGMLLNSSEYIPFTKEAWKELNKK